MRIINREEFLKLPSGTVYCKYDPCIFREVQVKACNTANQSDWYSYDLFSLGAKTGYHLNDTLDSMEKDSNLEVKTSNVPLLCRDSLFEEDQLFAVFSEEDIERLIKALTEWRNLDFS